MRRMTHTKYANCRDIDVTSSHTFGCGRLRYPCPSMSSIALQWKSALPAFEQLWSRRVHRAHRRVHGGRCALRRVARLIWQDCNGPDRDLLGSNAAIGRTQQSSVRRPARGPRARRFYQITDVFGHVATARSKDQRRRPARSVDASWFRPDPEDACRIFCARRHIHRCADRR